MVSSAIRRVGPGGQERGAAGPSFASRAHIQRTLAAVNPGNREPGGPGRLRTHPSGCR